MSYTPPSGTFASTNRARDLYHRIRIKVKRPGLTVRSRDGFFGLPGPWRDPRQAQPPDVLQKALVSPFNHNDLKLHLASAFANDSRNGYYLRSWLHLDAKDLVFVNEQDGGQAVSLEVFTLTANLDGQVEDSQRINFDFYFSNESLPKIMKNGIGFDMFLPVKKPGPYYVRAAIADRASGKIGSAYQFLEIPDLKKNQLALSSIILIHQAGNQVSPADVESASGASMDNEDAQKSPALRSYQPGEKFSYVYYVFNVKLQEGITPQLESQILLFKDGKEFFKGETLPIDLKAVSDLKRIPLTRTLSLGKSMDQGEYVMQLLVTDKLADKKNNVVSQAIDFEIRKE